MKVQRTLGHAYSLASRRALGCGGTCPAAWQPVAGHDVADADGLDGEAGLTIPGATAITADDSSRR